MGEEKARKLKWDRVNFLQGGLHRKTKKRQPKNSQNCSWGGGGQTGTFHYVRLDSTLEGEHNHKSE